MDNDCRTNPRRLWADQGLNVSSELKPCSEHTFLFVNESTARSGFKPGRRHEVRSHVRKHVMLNYKKSKESERKREVDLPRYRVLAPLEAVLPKTTLLEQDNKLYRAAFSEEHLHEGMPHIQELEDDWVEMNDEPSSRPKSTPVPTGITPGVAMAYCFHCGAPSTAIQKTKIGDTEQNRQRELGQLTHRNSMNPDPIRLLGAGRVDPFLSYPGEATNPSTHELMDHAITYLLPGLVPDGENNTVNPVAQAWFAAGLTQPLLFHALVFAGSIHLDFMRSSTIHPNSPVALSHKLAVIQKLNMILSNPKEAQKDEVILAILILASHEARCDSESKIQPFQSPLKSAQWLNVYGNIQYVPQHMTAVMELLTLRGGIETLKLHGLAETIVCGDIIAATNTLSRPALPPLRSLGTWIENVIAWAHSPARFPVQILGQGFRGLELWGVTPDMLYVFRATGSATIAIDHYLQGIPAGLTIGQISKVRTAVHQRLLLLPSSDELPQLPSHRVSIYDACRTTALIYSIAVLYPIPNTYQPFQKLVSRLKLSIETEKIDKQGSLSDVSLWMLVVGGIAALEKLERAWFVSRLVDFVRRWNIYDWGKVENVLESYLWLDSACGQGGRRLWSEVMEQQLANCHK